jgi:antitoxin MazE
LIDAEPFALTANNRYGISHSNITAVNQEALMTKMHLGKWGRSLAVRIPSALVEQFGLKEGDVIDTDIFESALAQAKQAALAAQRQQAIEEIRKRRFSLPADWKFDREEANWRPAMDRW